MTSLWIELYIPNIYNLNSCCMGIIMNYHCYLKWNVKTGTIYQFWFFEDIKDLLKCLSKPKLNKYYMYLCHINSIYLLISIFHPKNYWMSIFGENLR